MNTNTVHYKGFDIGYCEDGRFRIVPATVGFNADGYSAMNNAKGAITKYLAAKAIDDGFISVVILHKDKLPKISLVHSPVIKSRNKREGIFTGKLNGHKIRLGKRNLPKGATKHIPVPSWIAAAWQNRKFVAKKVGV